jgi:hypothetical protein
MPGYPEAIGPLPVVAERAARRAKTTRVPAAALDELLAALDRWLADIGDDADLIDALGDFVERIGGTLPSSTTPFRNRPTGP